jgi:pimeloyl-ACP methyl ester carboxylesterase
VTAAWGRMTAWWVQDYAYAALWQVRALVSRTQPESYLGGEKTPIVVIPGVYETWKFLQPVIETLHADGHPVHVVDPLSRNRRPVADAASQVAIYLGQHDLRHVVIVGHSKGGLIGKYVMALGPESARVDAMLAVAAPFGGSRYARFMIARSLRLFSPTDPTLLALSREEAVNARIVSVYGRFDPHIPEGSYLPGAKNVELETGGHFRILAHPRVRAELAALADGSEASRRS